MSKLIELVEDYGILRYRLACIGERNHAKLAARADERKEEIRTRLEALERDAARYRWLRHAPDDWQLAICTNLDAIDHGSSNVIGVFDEILTGEDADKAIDAAMEAAK